MHYYGDDWPYWTDLHTSIHEILDYWRDHGLGSQGKEKWGTFRDHVHWSDGTLFSVSYPGYVYIPPRWRWFYFNIDNTAVKKVVYYTGIWLLYNRYQQAVYRQGVLRALEKYPHIHKELTCSLDYPELLEQSSVWDVLLRR